MDTFVSFAFAANAVCAVAAEPDIKATIARAMPNLRIRFLPEVCDFASQTVLRSVQAIKPFGGNASGQFDLIRNGAVNFGVCTFNALSRSHRHFIATVHSPAASGANCRAEMAFAGGANKWCC
jgi:hypothetical protein